MCLMTVELSPLRTKRGNQRVPRRYVNYAKATGTDVPASTPSRAPSYDWGVSWLAGAQRFMSHMSCHSRSFSASTFQVQRGTWRGLGVVLGGCPPPAGHSHNSPGDYGADINGIYLEEPFIFHVIRHWPANTVEHFPNYPQIDVSLCAKSGESLLWFAVHQQRFSIVRELRSRPDMVLTHRGWHDHTLLSSAIWHGNMSLFQLLMANPRVPVNQRARMGASPLYWAIYRRQYCMAERLVQDERVDVNGVNTPSSSIPIVYASRRRLSIFLALLLQNPRIDLSRTDDTGCTALWHALNSSHNPSIELLLGHMKHIQDCSNSVTGVTLGQLAIVRGCETVVKLLLGQDRKIRSDARCSDWFHAARHDQVGIVKLFLDSGMDINAADMNGDTALHHAVRHGNNFVVTHLLRDEKTDVNRRNRWAGTALHVAVQNLCDL